MKVLLRKLYERLSQDGVLMFCNFTPDSHGRGFMEAFMDWSLIYRDEAKQSVTIPCRLDALCTSIIFDELKHYADMRIMPRH